MKIITQDVKFKQSVIKYSYKNGVTAASITYKLHRKTIYRWIKRYDGRKRKKSKIFASGVFIKKRK